MPGQIKIDDGSGNYTILTNAGSLGSDKTITIPNETATLATTNGITNAQQFRLTSNVVGTGALQVLTNFEEVDTYYSAIGSNVSHSSGVYSFSSTGIYLISFTITGIESGITTSSDQFDITLQISTDGGSNYNNLAQMWTYYTDASIENSTNTSQALVNITDTTNNKIRLVLGTVNTMLSNTTINGNTDYTTSNILFLKVG